MRLFKVLKILAAMIIATVLIGVGACTLWLDKDRPTLSDKAGADDLARSMMDAVDHQAWLDTGAVQWDFGGRQKHLWDRRRGYVQVDWKENRVQLDLQTRKGVAWVAGEPVTGEALEDLEAQAWSHWCNDSFWLNPIAKIFDDGTTRAIVETEGGDGLWVGYGSGGVTPGDGYLWHLGDDGLPVAWQMWTQILPVGGVRAGWQDWITLETGAKIATRHPTPLFELELSDVAGAATLTDLTGGTDPFGPLESYLQENRP